MRRWAAAAVAMIFVTACADGPTVEELVDLNPVAPDPDRLERSVRELDGTGSFTETEAALVDLLLPPSSVPGRHRLAALEVDDPNGDGTIGEHWYPPRILHRACNWSLDQPPTPTVAGVFIAGDPARGPSEGLAGMLTAPSRLAISIAVLDDATQRDGLLEPMLELNRELGEFECDLTEQMEALVEGLGADTDLGEGADVDDLFGGADMNDLFGRMWPTVEEFTPVATGHPGWGFAFDGLGANGPMVVYAVGDRVILTVTNQTTGFLATDDDVEPSLDFRQFSEVIVLQVERLVASGYG